MINQLRMHEYIIWDVRRQTSSKSKQYLDYYRELMATQSRKALREGIALKAFHSIKGHFKGIPLKRKVQNAGRQVLDTLTHSCLPPKTAQQKRSSDLCVMGARPKGTQRQTMYKQDAGFVSFRFVFKKGSQTLFFFFARGLKFPHFLPWNSKIICVYIEFLFQKNCVICEYIYSNVHSQWVV